MVNSNFDDLGVIEKMRMRATTFILGVWGHVIEKVVGKLGFSQKPGSSERSKIQRNGSSQKLCSDGSLFSPNWLIFDTQGFSSTRNRLAQAPSSEKFFVTPYQGTPCDTLHSGDDHIRDIFEATFLIERF